MARNWHGIRNHILADLSLSWLNRLKTRKGDVGGVIVIQARASLQLMTRPKRHFSITMFHTLQFETLSLKMQGKNSCIRNRTEGIPHVSD